jgi:dTDP-4-amino-4,6-dideoxygalactose transaminase
MNSRLDELQAAILKVRLKWLPEFTERRRKIAGAYQKGIKNNLIRKLAEPEEQLAHVYHLFVVQCDQRERLQDHFQSNQIQTLIHYPIPIHKQESCLAIKRDTHGLRNSENHASTCLSLPCHPQMNARDVAKVIEIANSFN